MNNWQEAPSWEERLGAAVFDAREWLKRTAKPRFLARLLLHPGVLAIGYAGIGLVTFGHVAGANYRAEQYEYQQCDSARAAGHDSYEGCPMPEPVIDAIYGAGAGIFWPLYVSWEIQQ